jgi:hypothetical protein
MVLARLPITSFVLLTTAVSLSLFGCKKFDEIGKVPEVKLPEFEKPNLEGFDIPDLNFDDLKLFERPCEKSEEELSLKVDEKVKVIAGEYEIQNLRIVRPNTDPQFIIFDPNKEDSIFEHLLFSTYWQLEVIYDATTPEDVKEVRVESERVCQTSRAVWVAEDKFPDMPESLHQSARSEDGTLAQASLFTTSGRINLILTDSASLVTPFRVGVMPGLNKLRITFLGECKRSQVVDGKSTCLEDTVLKTQSVVIDYQITRKHIPGERTIDGR